MKLDILRRKIAVAGLMLGPLAALAPVAPTPAAAAGNPIVTENQQPGTDAWLIGLSRVTMAPARSRVTRRRRACFKTRA